MNSKCILLTGYAIILTLKSTESFQVASVDRRTISRYPNSLNVPNFAPFGTTVAKNNRLAAKNNKDLDNEEEDERDFARVRRSSKYSQYDDEQDSDGFYYDDRKGTSKQTATDNELYDDADEDDDDDWDNEEEYELLGDVLIPNPILDSIDPDGAAERFPELARDPKFWFDMLLFVAFLDFVSYAGPRNPFPDGPMW